MLNRVAVMGVASLLAWTLGCGDDASGEACKEGMAEGDSIACMCDDTMAGVQTCGADKTLSACDCSGGGLPDGGILPTGGTGGTTTATGGTGGAGGVGGAGDEDSGVDNTPVDGGTKPPPGPPSDGTELSTCDVADSSSCGDGLACYNSGNGPGYCTKACMPASADTDCAGLTSATCSQGACRYTCTGTEDTSCPMFMECVEVVAGTFRCNYPEDVGQPPPEPGDGTIYSVCTATEDCGAGLRCNSYGHCTHDCVESTDCEAASTGDLDPTCSPNTMIMNQEVPGSGCRFTCDLATNPDVCPEGLSCTQSFGGGRCTSSSPGGGLPGGGLPGGGLPGSGG